MEQVKRASIAEASVIVVRTKCDEPVAFCGELAKVFDWCRTNGIPYVSTSAKENINVEALFQLAARMAALKMQHRK